jgi:hypothetical protein
VSTQFNFWRVSFLLVRKKEKEAKRLKQLEEKRTKEESKIKKKEEKRMQKLQSEIYIEGHSHSHHILTRSPSHSFIHSLSHSHSLILSLFQTKHY